MGVAFEEWLVSADDLLVEMVTQKATAPKSWIFIIFTISLLLFFFTRGIKYYEKVAEVLDVILFVAISAAASVSPVDPGR